MTALHRAGRIVVGLGSALVVAGLVLAIIAVILALVTGDHSGPYPSCDRWSTC